MMENMQWVKIYADKEESSIPDFQYDWSYVNENKKESETYLHFKDAFFFDGSSRIERKLEPKEHKQSGMKLARLAIQVYEKELDGLTEQERRKIKTDSTSYNVGFWNDKDEFLEAWGNVANAGKTPAREYIRGDCINGYPSNKNAKFYFYNMGLFDSMEMARSLLKLFGKGDEYFQIYVTQERAELKNEEHNKPTYGTDENVAVNLAGENIILYGVPGSGKSYAIKYEIAKLLGVDVEDTKTVESIYRVLNDKNRICRVVFHPDYTYSDFTGQILPKAKDGKIDYRFTPGPFTRILKEAVSNPQDSYFLIIEEINRGNAAAIFGDLFQLLDREDSNGEHPSQSEYPIDSIEISKEVYNIQAEESEMKKIYIPRNLWILATMNTSNQNVFTLDTAFQRRWDMRLIHNEFTEKHDFIIEGTNWSWRKFAEAVNIHLEKGDSITSEDKRLGAWFIKPDTEKDDGSKEISKERFANKVLKYLWDDAFKFNRNELFNTERYPTLEKVISAFNKGESSDIFEQQFSSELFAYSETEVLGETEGDNG